MKFALITLAALTAPISAATLWVDNLCPFELYLQPSTAGQATGPVRRLAPNTINAYNEPLKGPGNTNAAVTVARTPNLASPLQMVYTQTTQGSGITYYDLSTIYGDPLRAQGFALRSGGNGYTIRCPPRGTNGGDCPNTYSPSNRNGNNAVFTQQNSASFALRLCDSS